MQVQNMALYKCKIFASRKKFFFSRFSVCLPDLLVLKNETISPVRRTNNKDNLCVSLLFLVNFPGKMTRSTLLSFFVTKQ